MNPCRLFRSRCHALFVIGAAAAALSGCFIGIPPVVHKAVLPLPPVEVAVAVPTNPPAAPEADAAREPKPPEVAVFAARPAAPVFLRDLPSTVYFDNDAYLVAPQFRPMLAQHARNLKADPNLRLQILAFTDARGGVDYNRALSQTRAASVVKVLAEMGVSRAQLEPMARGAERATTRSGAAANDARSRRVDLLYRR